MSDPLVSICMTAYNAEKYVAEALDSALAQTWLVLEIILVNDGSTDATGAIADEYAEGHREAWLLSTSLRGPFSPSMSH